MQDIQIWIQIFVGHSHLFTYYTMSHQSLLTYDFLCFFDVHKNLTLSASTPIIYSEALILWYRPNRVSAVRFSIIVRH